MPYIPPEVVEQARQIDLLTYLQSCEPQELVRISGNNYTTRTHDSLKISNGKWMWWSQRIGGYNALDYLVKVGLFFCRGGLKRDGKGGGDAVSDDQANAENGAEGLTSAG